MKIVELSAIAKGRVQGVGFRATAKALADELKLAGYVRNLSDGSVEICAQGEKDQVDTFLLHLRRQFPSGSITAIDYREPSKNYADFKIIR